MSTLSIQGVGRTFARVSGGKRTLTLQATNLDVAHNDIITVLRPIGLRQLDVAGEQAEIAARSKHFERRFSERLRAPSQPSRSTVFLCRSHA